jgi:acetyl-CoA acetyltransferase
MPDGHRLRVAFTPIGGAASTRPKPHNEGRTGMASSGKKKTTMAKLMRESRLRERRLDKQARKDARKRAPADPEDQPGDALDDGFPQAESPELVAAQIVPAGPRGIER